MWKGLCFFFICYLLVCLGSFGFVRNTRFKPKTVFNNRKYFDISFEVWTNVALLLKQEVRFEPQTSTRRAECIHPRVETMQKGLWAETINFQKKADNPLREGVSRRMRQKVLGFSLSVSRGDLEQPRARLSGDPVQALSPCLKDPKAALELL